MPVTSRSIAVEKSMFVVNCAFTDRDDSEVTPDSIVYTLTDTSGTVINSIDGTAITPSTDVDIVLSGDDLQILAGEVSLKYAWRKLFVEAVVDVSVGNNLPLNDEFEFRVFNSAYKS